MVMESSILLFALSICGTCWVTWHTNTVQCPQTHVYTYSWFLWSMLYEITKFHSILWQVCVWYYLYEFVEFLPRSIFSKETCTCTKLKAVSFENLYFCFSRPKGSTPAWVKKTKYFLLVRSISRYCNPKGECVHAVNMLCCLILMCVV